MSIVTAVSRGDIHRTSFDPNRQIPLYLGSGSCGALFDSYGLIGQVDKQKTGGDVGTFKHADYYAQGHYGIDYWLSLFTLKLADEPQAEPTDYRQSLSVTHPNGSYNESFDVTPQTTDNGFRMQTNRVTMEVGMRVICENGSYGIRRNGADWTLTLSDNATCLLLIGSANEKRFAAVRSVMDGVASIASWRESAENGWKTRWGDSYLDLTDDQRQADWARSMYYVLCSFSPDGIPSAPMGWTGAGWRFHFPQDISYIHPALLRMGHYDLAKRIVEFYRERIDDIRVSRANGLRDVAPSERRRMDGGSGAARHPRIGGILREPHGEGGERTVQPGSHAVDVAGRIRQTKRKELLVRVVFGPLHVPRRLRDGAEGL